MLVAVIAAAWLAGAAVTIGVVAALSRSGRRADEESEVAARRILEPAGELRLAVSNPVVAERSDRALCPGCASLVAGAAEGDACPACGAAVTALPRIRPLPVSVADPGGDARSARPHRAG